MKRLREFLLSGLGSANAPGLHSDAQILSILEALRCFEYPLIEKLNTFLFYQDWFAGRPLPEAAVQIGLGARDLLGGDSAPRHSGVLAHFKADLLAQLLREGGQAQRYFGLDVFIAMSSGLPRNLLTVLKFVHRWSLFRGERPFDGYRPITLAAQGKGVLEASTWFFEDARAAGARADLVQGVVERLARFLHRLRFSPKPVECSAPAVSFDEAALSARARAVLDEAQGLSLLLRVLEGQKDRNELGVVSKFQLNPMVCPRYDLPVSRRGAGCPSPPSRSSSISAAAPVPRLAKAASCRSACLSQSVHS